MAVLAVSGIFRGLDAMSYQIWVSRGLTGPLFKFYLYSRPVMIALILAGLPWGPVGVALGHLIAAVADWLVGTRLACRSARLPAGAIFSSSLLVVLLVLAPAGSLAHLATYLDVPGVVQIVVGAAAAGVWAVAVVTVVPRFRRELVALLSSVRGRRGELSTCRRLSRDAGEAAPPAQHLLADVRPGTGHGDGAPGPGSISPTATSSTRTSCLRRPRAGAPGRWRRRPTRGPGRRRRPRSAPCRRGRYRGATGSRRER